MKIAIYARESSDDITQSPPIENQIERGKQWAKENGYEVVQVYSDNGFSGANWKRPEWNKSLLDAKRNLWQILWVFNQDRIARDTEQFLYYYRILKEAKRTIYEEVSSDFIDMESLGGRVKHQTLAQAGEIFRLVTSEKVKAAYRRKKKSDPWGRPVLNVDMYFAQRLREDGYSWREIGQKLSVSHNTIRRRFKKLMEK